MTKDHVGYPSPSPPLIDTTQSTNAPTKDASTIWLVRSDFGTSVARAVAALATAPIADTTTAT